MSETISGVKRRGSGRPPARELEAHKEAILDAATATFLEHGYSKASTAEIARRAGASKQTIYSLYPSKAELFAALMQRRSARLIDPLASQVLRDDAPVEEVLRRFAFQVVRLLLTEVSQRLHRIIISEAKSFPELVGAFWANGPGWGRETLKVYLDAQVAGGVLEVGNTRYAANQFIGSLADVIVMHSMLMLPTPLEGEKAIGDWVEMGVSAFLRAYRKMGD
ncbi:TetR/AcrR family transcriptional regulator [Granulicella tundricola]|uniref:Transcriptional regulator, TetR family n=1 Tax=Granulicella tundricola (strain ATCC BAA-1859 / DSM 23138 / MP5ACTX9) TaxID=1198114 RepID=E8X4B8_GRATM|nr:TetR/AcrR family transcriptional regulator [Granulicella tundricola]ADW68245.1 transcriptional regulator, TetR family [Granulicella tundricola MP5ACTX9]